jgi:hypothetical protein
MNTEVERVEQYLRDIAVPEYVSERHRQQLRRQVLGEIGKRWAIPLPGKPWRLAAAAAIVVGVAGLVGTFIGMNYCATSRKSGGTYASVGKDTAPIYMISALDANDALDVEPREGDLALIDYLQRQDAVKLVRVIESEVNGRLDSRTLVHRYALPDGRTRTIGEGDPDGAKETPPTRLTTAAWTEIGQLRQTGKGENLGTQEKEVKGREFVFNRARYTLHDGTQVIVSVGEPKDTEQPQD